MVNLILYQGDALKILPTLPSESVDMVLTDPPMMISRNIKITRTRNIAKFCRWRGKDIDLFFGEWDVFPSEKDFLKFTFNWVKECVRILKKGRIFASFFDRDKINFLSYYLQKIHNFKCKGYFAYIKRNPVPQARKVKWMNAWEEAGLWQKPGGKLVYNYQLGQHPDYIILPICQGKERTEHPTQKPEKLIEPFIKYWTNEGDTVLDPFLGSGTTMKVCRDLNRNCIGIEINPKYIEITKKRLNWGSSLGGVKYDFRSL
ncbi:MAG: site-specific DNA-methyltransferase [Candidatus Pacearchaeota archaeon]